MMFVCHDCNREVSDSYGKKYLSNKTNEVFIVNGRTQIRCPRCHISALEQDRDNILTELSIANGKVANLVRDIQSIKEVVDEVSDGEPETPETCE